MGQNDSELTAPRGPAKDLFQEHEHEQQRQPGDHIGHDERGGDHAGEQHPALEAAKAGEHIARHGAEDRGTGGRDRGDPETELHRIHDGAVVQQFAVPLGGEPTPDRHQLRDVEAENDERQDWPVEKQVSRDKQG